MHAPEVMNALKKMANKYKKRAGAKAVKAFERESGVGRLSESDATTFRALSARANDLAQDRPDISIPERWESTW